MRQIWMLLLMAISVASFSQTILLEEDVEGDTIPETFGPNLKRFAHLYFDYGFFADEPEGDGGDILYGSSHTFGLGWRNKFKLNNTFAFGYDIHLSQWVYRLKQDYDGKSFPDSINTHKKEKLVTSNLGAELYFRINYGRRGNHIGNFIDIGAYGDWLFRVNHHIVDILDDPNAVHAKKVVTTNTRLQYVEDYAYGVNARIGFNRYCITASYRLSDLILSDFNMYPEMPRLSIGIQLGVH